ncbi:hydroxyectoine utilization dehydratase EutB [Alteribacillus sp. YIM 98480]|uniref:hydroxyectoine utilization dehydratase EutB n=1 Tax=Alteribacillus sp. YIM 98480 TaxID=2606599 RepID=UPI00131C556F|nr:hydroxyectoine utilization dehydratase EutB [Alteribacillus sp. YIM 98480]
MKQITVKDIWKAKKRIRTTLEPTPLTYSKNLSKHTGVPIYLKLEQLQPTGSFKLRGASTMIASLTKDEQQNGVVTFSTGNHGFAVAYAAVNLGIKAVVCVSKNVPQEKINALQESGAELHIEGESQDEAADVCLRLQKEKGFTLIPPFDHPDIIAGQGTIGLEILEDLPEVETVLSGLSGGGLLSGIGLALKETDPDIQVIGLSVEKGAAMDDSIKAGKPVAVPEHPTYADSLLGGIGMQNRYTLPMISRYIDQRLRLSEEEIARGMAFLYENHRFIVEGAAAVGAAALLEKHVQPKGPAVVVVTGNSISADSHYKAVKPYLKGS